MYKKRHGFLLSRFKEGQEGLALYHVFKFQEKKAKATIQLDFFSGNCSQIQSEACFSDCQEIYGAIFWGKFFYSIYLRELNIARLLTSQAVVQYFDSSSALCLLESSGFLSDLSSQNNIFQEITNTSPLGS